MHHDIPYLHQIYWDVWFQKERLQRSQKYIFSIAVINSTLIRSHQEQCRFSTFSINFIDAWADTSAVDSCASILLLQMRESEYFELHFCSKPPVPSNMKINEQSSILRHVRLLLLLHVSLMIHRLLQINEDLMRHSAKKCCAGGEWRLSWVISDAGKVGERCKLITVDHSGTGSMCNHRYQTCL